MKKTLAILGLAVVLSTSSLVAATAGTVNGMKISVEEANEALNVLTKGQKTWDALPADGKTQLIQMMAPAKLVAAESKKSLTEKEKEAALAGFWMQKSMAETKITDEEAQAAYDKMKEEAKKAKSKEQIPAFEAVKNNIKMQLAQGKVVSKLMKSAKIEVK
ncbi:hypothetical protein [Sulfurovum sp.]|uniref:hypothetical protein n=1 Tax=Sulfurovum sp. TaxID=1969726 RepID=UPI002867EBD5|nr:hypothetical protein [Sulfurovum sp.]